VDTFTFGVTMLIGMLALSFVVAVVIGKAIALRDRHEP
jgi:hypothetical protein